MRVAPMRLQPSLFTLSCAKSQAVRRKEAIEPHPDHHNLSKLRWLQLRLHPSHRCLEAWIDVNEVLVAQSCLRSDPFLRVVSQELFQQIDACRIQVWAVIQKGHTIMMWPIALVVGELNHAWPHFFRGRAEYLEDPLELVSVRGARKQGSSRCHLAKYAPHTPEIDGC